jgi:VanZ family protein
MAELFSQYLNIDISAAMLRNAMHIIEFSMLTALSYFAFVVSSRVSDNYSFVQLSQTDMKSSFEMNASFSLWITVLYSVLDEYHQLFVAGRDGSIIDVLIDILAGTVVLVVFRIVLAMYLLLKKRKKLKTEVETQS